jgi:hypothetical protein
MPVRSTPVPSPNAGGAASCSTNKTCCPPAAHSPGAWPPLLDGGILGLQVSPAGRSWQHLRCLESSCMHGV